MSSPRSRSSSPSVSHSVATQIRDVNIFEVRSTVGDPVLTKQGILATRLFVLFLIVSFIILSVYYATQTIGVVRVIKNPTEQDFQFLYYQEPQLPNLNCPCSNIAISNRAFSRFRYTVNSVCSMRRDLKNMAAALHQRARAAYQVIPNLCDSAQAALNGSREDFFSSSFVSPQVLSADVFLSTFEQTDSGLKGAITSSWRRSIDTTRVIFAANLPYSPSNVQMLTYDHSELMNNGGDIVSPSATINGTFDTARGTKTSIQVPFFDPVAKKNVEDLIYYGATASAPPMFTVNFPFELNTQPVMPAFRQVGNCDCFKAPVGCPAVQYDARRDPDMAKFSPSDQDFIQARQYDMCYMFDSVLESSVEYFYDELGFMAYGLNSSAFLRVFNEDNKPLVWGPTYVTEYYDRNYQLQPTSKVSDFLDVMFLDEWEIRRDYSQYFAQCKPAQCTYTEERKVNAVEILTQLLGLFGGLSALLKIVTPKIAEFFVRGPGDKEEEEAAAKGKQAKAEGNGHSNGTDKESSALNEKRDVTIELEENPVAKSI